MENQFYAEIWHPQSNDSLPPVRIECNCLEPRDHYTIIMGYIKESTCGYDIAIATVPAASFVRLIPIEKK